MLDTVLNEEVKQCFALQHYSGYATNEVEMKQILSKASNDRVLRDVRVNTSHTHQDTRPVYKYVDYISFKHEVVPH